MTNLTAINPRQRHIADTWPQCTDQESFRYAIRSRSPPKVSGLCSPVPPDLRFPTSDSLAMAQDLAQGTPPDVLMVDKAFGIQAILDWLRRRSTRPGPEIARMAIVIWGVSVSEAEALRFLQAGARGILRKTAGFAWFSPASALSPPDEAGWRIAFFAIPPATTVIRAAN